MPIGASSNACLNSSSAFRTALRALIRSLMSSTTETVYSSRPSASRINVLATPAHTSSPSERT